jgi:ribosome biogenesis GTPase A
MASFWEIVNRVIKESDMLLEVLDARMVKESRNREIEDKVKKSGKILIYVINKCDMVEKSTLEKYKQQLHPCVFVSATSHLGTTLLKQMILRHAPKDKFKVGVLGYPNTGKSSIINALKGHASAPVSSVSGHTKGMQWIRASPRMYLLDTPGVFPYKEKDEGKHAMITAKTFSNLKDPEEACMQMIDRFPTQVEKFYGVKHDKDPEAVLESIALKLKKLRKGGLPDINAAARIILRDWQQGRIKK